MVAPAPSAVGSMRPGAAAPDRSNARLFLALWPPASVRAALAAHARAWRWPAGAQRYAPADWHVTLHFLGAVPRSRLPELSAALAVPAAGFVLRFGVPALWPHGLAVLLPSELAPALLDLHAQLAQRLQQLGCRTEARPYTPHLTLARRAAQAQPPAAAPPWSWAVRGYALAESTGEPQRRYRLLRRYRLQPPAAAAL